MTIQRPRRHHNLTVREPPKRSEDEIARTREGQRQIAGGLLRVSLKNLRTLAAEVQDIVDVAGDSVDVVKLQRQVGETAQTFWHMLEALKREAGVVEYGVDLVAT